KNPAERYESALALLDTFDTVLQSQDVLETAVTGLHTVPTAAFPQMTVQLPPPVRAKRRTSVFIGIALVPVVVIGLVVGILAGRRQPGVAPTAGTSTAPAVAMLHTDATATTLPPLTVPTTTPLPPTAMSTSTPAPTATATLVPSATPNIQETIAAGMAMTASAQAAIALASATQ